MRIINSKSFLHTLGFIIIAELLSFLSFFIPDISPWLFGIVAIIALAGAIKKLEYGIWLIIAELIIGSQGYIFSLEFGGMEISIRLALWLIVMSVWLAKAINNRRVEFLRCRLFKTYLSLAIVIIWGVGWGLIRGNNFGAIFFDANNYLFFALIFPFYEVLRSNEKIHKVMSVGAAALAWLAAKTLILFYIFSHPFIYLQEQIYDWTRLRLLAEITNVSETASRIFMQSQVWLVFALFALLGYLFYLIAAKGVKQSASMSRQSSPMSHLELVGGSRDSSTPLCSAWNDGAKAGIGIIILLSSIIISFSRSFWAAIILSLIIFLALCVTLLKQNLRSAANFGAVAVGAIMLSVGLTMAIAAFPLPSGTGSGSLIRDRAGSLADAAASTRWAILTPLAKGIIKHPIIGSGFGSEITYKTQDPRALASRPDGLYTTSAFEWGYLDMIYKFGVTGLLVYLYLIYIIIKISWQGIKILPGDLAERYLLFGALIGLIAVALAHGVSPYLNHPLGIGIVVLITCVIGKTADSIQTRNPNH